MDLHRVRKKPDWELVPVNEHNVYQRIAAVTKGFVTPGNVITLAGLVMVLTGVSMLTEGISITALSLIGIGRFVDLVDGYIANKTETKSQVGEAFDSMADKVTAFAVLVVFVLSGILLIWQAGILLLLQIINSIITVKVKVDGKTIHSSRSGKQATFLLWLTVGIFAVAALLPSGQPLNSVVSLLGNVFLIVAAIVGYRASVGYYSVFKKS